MDRKSHATVQQGCGESPVHTAPWIEMRAIWSGAHDNSADGYFSNFDVAAAVPGSYQGTATFSINSRDAVTGEWLDGNSVMAFRVYPLVTSLRSARLTPVPVLDRGRALPLTNNLQGQVTGWYVDANNLNHGFLWAP